MIHYTAHGDTNTRVLEVVANSAHRFRFFDGVGHQVKFKQHGSKLIAAVSGRIRVYQKPNSHEWHREVMAHNNKALWLGLQSDTDRLLDNMLEYVETI